MGMAGELDQPGAKTNPQTILVANLELKFPPNTHKRVYRAFFPVAQNYEVQVSVSEFLLTILSNLQHPRPQLLLLLDYLWASLVIFQSWSDEAC